MAVEEAKPQSNTLLVGRRRSDGARILLEQDDSGNLYINGTVVEASAVAMLTALQVLDNIVSGSEAQVDIVAALPTGTNRIGKTDRYITKTIETELKAITAVAANVQSISSELDLTGQEKQVTILIDHAKDNASASVGQGTEYVVQVSEKASGDDTWRALASFTAAITVPTAMVADNAEVGPVIECDVATPVVGDILFFKLAVLANSEWSNVIARVDGESVTLESTLANAIAAGGTYYTQGEHFPVTINVESITRLRVVCNNTKGTTNRAIVWRCAAITSE